MQPSIDKGCIFIYIFYIGKKFIYFIANYKFFVTIQNTMEIESQTVQIYLKRAELLFP